MRASARPCRAIAGPTLAVVIAVRTARPDHPVFPTTISLLGVRIGLLTGVSSPPRCRACGVVRGDRPGSWASGIGSVTGIAGAQPHARRIDRADPDLPAMR